ncbi:MAG: single-stranded DNA-binding protein, partial [Clostridia bacterium]|nr:single-stranded DNA-binding protein [Clostridia bacterium]
FTIAVGRKFSRDSSQQQTDFINIVCWRSTAEFVTKYFSKGKSILVCGSLQTRNWTDQQGQKHYITEVVADEVSFVERKSDGSSGGAPMPMMNAEPAPYSNASKDTDFEEMATDEDLPF